MDTRYKPTYYGWALIESNIKECYLAGVWEEDHSGKLRSNDPLSGSKLLFYGRSVICLKVGTHLLIMGTARGEPSKTPPLRLKLSHRLGYSICPCILDPSSGCLIIFLSINIDVMTFGWCTFTRQGFIRTLPRGACDITGSVSSRPSRGVLK